MSMSNPYHHVNLGVNQQHQSTYDAVNAAKGAPFHADTPMRRWEQCTILEVFPATYTCTVFSETGAIIDGVGFPEDGSHVPAINGTDYAVHFSTGEPMLVVASSSSRYNDEEQTPSQQLTPVRGVGGEDPLLREKGLGGKRGSRAADVLPGDWVKSNPAGNLIAVLEGGATMIKASELAQIILTQANDLVRIMGKNVTMDTGMGSIKLHTVDGKSTLDMQLGGDEATESHPSKDNYRIRLRMGAAGEMSTFKVTDQGGRTLFCTDIDPDGRLHTLARNRTLETLEDVVSVVGGELKETIGGSVERAVGGASKTAVGGDAEVTVGGTHATVARQDAQRIAGRDSTSFSRRNYRNVALGSGTGSVPSMSFNASNGDVFFDVGNPLNGDVQTRASAFKVQTTTGDMVFTSPLGDFNVRTTMPGSVSLGGAFGAPFSGVLYEFFDVVMSTVASWLDTHTHTAAGVPTSPPIFPVTPFIRATVPACKSYYVKFGG